MRHLNGDLIKLALDGEFDVITHGCNCFCTMGAGIAVPMKEIFGCDKFPMEHPKYRGDINKLGIIDWKSQWINPGTESQRKLVIINSYTQYYYGRNHKDGVSNPADYDAIRLCMRKINHIFPGKTIGLPLIGSGLAGGKWSVIESIIENELKDMNIIIVHYKK